MPLKDDVEILETHHILLNERFEVLKKDLSQMSDKLVKIEDDMSTRMDKLESMINSIRETLLDKETSALKTLITLGIAAITGLLGVSGGLLWYIIINK